MITAASFGATGTGRKWSGSKARSTKNFVGGGAGGVGVWSGLVLGNVRPRHKACRHPPYLDLGTPVFQSCD